MRFVTVAIVLSMASALACAAPASAAPAAGSGQNLIVNGDAEAGPGSADGSTLPVPGWTIKNGFAPVLYGAPGGFPRLTDAGPLNRGKNFFAGGVSTPASSAVQVIDLSAFSTAINAGHSQFSLSGWLGGYATQSDYASLSAVFRNSSGESLSSASLTSVGSGERGGVTGFVFRNTDGMIPVGTALVDIVLDMRRVEGSYNDGYADNLSFSVSSVPEPGSWAMLGAGLGLLGFAARRRRLKALSTLAV